MHLCVHPFTLSIRNISRTNGTIAIKFYLKHHWLGERLHNVLGQIASELWFPWQQIVVGENVVATIAASDFIGSSSFL